MGYFLEAHPWANKNPQLLTQLSQNKMHIILSTYHNK